MQNRTSSWLKKMREKFGLTQAKLSEESGVNKLTIENIEQNRRKGSEATWQMIEDYFSKKELGENIIYSFDSESIIDELKEEIDLYGEDYPCIVSYEIVDDWHFHFTDYFIDDDKINIKNNEKLLHTNLKDALYLFEEQDKII